MNAKIKKAAFITSAKSIKDSPPPALSEIVFLGRSNVGKSSLINRLANSQGLAKSSKTPGKTQLLNFFEIDAEQNNETLKIMFVDLPGYGYAKVSKTLQEEWGKNLFEFLSIRDSIKLFVQLIDARHPDLPNDQKAEETIRGIVADKPDSHYLKVFTKSDKLTKNDAGKLRQKYKDAIIVSSLKSDNVSLLRDKIFTLIQGV